MWMESYGWNHMDGINADRINMDGIKVGAAGWNHMDGIMVDGIMVDGIMVDGIKVGGLWVCIFSREAFLWKRLSFLSFEWS
jgi:hypothetical protein